MRSPPDVNYPKIRKSLAIILARPHVSVPLRLLCPTSTELPADGVEKRKIGGVESDRYPPAAEKFPFIRRGSRKGNERKGGRKLGARGKTSGSIGLSGLASTGRAFKEFRSPCTYRLKRCSQVAPASRLLTEILLVRPTSTTRFLVSFFPPPEGDAINFPGRRPVKSLPHRHCPAIKVSRA